MIKKGLFVLNLACNVYKVKKKKKSHPPNIPDSMKTPQTTLIKVEPRSLRLDNDDRLHCRGIGVFHNHNSLNLDSSDQQIHL